MRDIKSLTGLRGYAALWVCLHHYNYGRYEGNLDFYLNFAKQGSWGVIIFFVLSGFIMAYVYQSWFRGAWDRVEYARFMAIRFARVYPLHFLTLLAWLGFCLIGFIGFNNNDTAYTFVLNLFLLHAWGFTDSISWNQPSWSISTEMFCYLVFPFWMAGVRRIRPRFLYPGILIVLLAVAYPLHVQLVKWVLSWFGTKLVVHGFEYGLSMLTWFFTFALGTMLFQAITGRGTRQGMANAAVIGGLILILLMVDKGHDLSSGFIRSMISAATAILIYGLYNESKIGNWLFGNRLAVFLGNVSYGLYLSHIMTPLVLDQMFMRLHSAQRMTAWPMWLQVSVALAVAALLHYRFEKPSRYWMRSRWAPRTTG